MVEATGVQAAAIELPWGAWHGDRRKPLACPAGWRIRELRMAGAPALTDAEIGDALDAPIEAPSLTTLASGRRQVAIAIDDITRPTRTAPLLRLLVDRLARAGVADRAITIVVASGAHRCPTERDLELKVGGELRRRVNVTVHDPAGDLTDTGVSLGGVRVRLNRDFAAADLRIGVSAVMPHPFAGYSGGGKIVIPGLADLDVLARTHKFALMGLRRAGGFRGEMEQAVADIGLHWSVNVVVNEARETVHVAAGDLVAAHRDAAAAAARVGATEPPGRPLDALVLNAYPKDSELLQIESAFVALRGGMLGWLAPGAPVILAGACSEGLGHHGLFGPGGRLARVPVPRSFLARHPLWLLAPGLNEQAVRGVFPEDYPCFSDWDALVSALERLVPPTPVLGVLPCGPLQVAADSSSPGAAGEGTR